MSNAMNSASLLPAAALLVMLPAALAAQVPAAIALQGTLYDDVGAPVHGTLPVQFTLYADPAGASAIWSSAVAVDFANGVFSVSLGDTEPLDPLLFADHPQVYVGIAVDGDEEMELFALATAPYAARAASAADADTVNGMAATEILSAAASDAAARYSPLGHGHPWSDLIGIPAGFADGVDNDTVLTEAQVDAFVSNNGYITGGHPVDLYNCARYPGSGWLNNMDAELNVTCPAGQVIQGLHSYHSNGTEDRQWAYYCCSLRVR